MEPYEEVQQVQYNKKGCSGCERRVSCVFHNINYSMMTIQCNDRRNCFVPGHTVRFQLSFLLINVVGEFSMICSLIMKHTNYGSTPKNDVFHYNMPQPYIYFYKYVFLKDISVFVYVIKTHSTPSNLFNFF